MSLSFSTTTGNLLLTQITNQIDAGSGPGTIMIYSGTIPASGDAALSSNTQLAHLVCSKPSSAAPSAKTLTFNPITQDTSADATGVASFFRILDSNANVIVQGAVTAVGGGGDLQMNTTSIVAGGPVQITACSFTLP